MAKVLNYKKYHKINVADHRHHHQQQQQQQQKQQQQQLSKEEEEVEQQQILKIKQQRKQRQTQIVKATNQSNNDNSNNNKNNKTKHSHTNNSNKKSKNDKIDNNNNEFIDYTLLQQHVAHNNDQQLHYSISNSNFQQLTSVSSFSNSLKNRKSKLNHSLNKYNNNNNNKHKHNKLLPSLDPPKTSTQPITLTSTLPPSTTCSYTPNKNPSSSSSSASLLTPLASNTLALNDSNLSALSSSTYLNLSSTYSTYSTCCVLTYNMFTAYAEAATLQLKRKTQFNKLLHVSGHPDMRSICYLILMAFFYWGVMIRAAVATNLTTTQTPTSASHVEELNTKGHIFYTNLTITTTTSPHNAAIALDGGDSTNTNLPLLLLNNNSSLKLPLSSLSSDDTLTNYQRRLLMRREAANVPDFEDDDSSYHDDELDEYELLIKNKSALGKYIGAPCNNSKCESTLLHVICEKDTNTCGCEKNYPVQLGLTRGCAKPKKLGEQCFYDETCQYNDENSLCVQVRHNAMCQCASGFHSVSYTKPTRRVFCTQDIDELNSDLPTLLGVCVGIGVLAGLICMVLHLFSKTKYPRHRNFGDANLPPPIMYSSETGIPLTVQSGRPSSRSSIRSSGGSIGSYGNRRSSTGGVGGNNSATAGSKGILVSTSRTGSRRPSLASVHSTSSSVRSYSMMRFEKEQQQKEIRQEMKLRLARLQQHQHQQQHQQHLSQYKPQIIIGDTAVSMQHGVALSRISMATPSPITPNSTDELLPAVDENQEYPPKSDKPPFAETVASATISAIKNVAASSGTNQNMSSTTTNAANIASTSSSTNGMDLANAAAYIGPCSSSNEAL